MSILSPWDWHLKCLSDLSSPVRQLSPLGRPLAGHPRPWPVEQPSLLPAVLADYPGSAEEGPCRMTWELQKPRNPLEFVKKVNKKWCKPNKPKKWCDMMWLSLIHRSVICSFPTPYSAIQQRIKYCCISTIREKAMPARYSRLFAWIPKSVFPRIHNHLAFATWFLGQRTLSSGHHTQLPGHGKDLNLPLEHWIPQDASRARWHKTRRKGQINALLHRLLCLHAEPCRAMQETWKRNEN